MGITTIIGIIIALGSLVLAFVLDGGIITALINPTAAMIVFGGTIGATTICFSKQELKTIPRLIKMCISKEIPDEVVLIEQLIDLSDKVRREGMLYLEKQLDQFEDSFMHKGIQLVVDGVDTEIIRMIMETEIYSAKEHQNTGVGIFETAGGFAPTMGIIGTVMGLVHVLGNLENPETLGPAIALAFLATLYGLASANIMWLPIAAKLRNIGEKEDVLRELMLEGLLSIHAGHNPVLVREKLTAFLKPGKRQGNGEED